MWCGLSKRFGSIAVNLSGERLYLRPLTLEDASGPYPSWFNDPEVCRYNSHGEKVYTRKMAEAYIREAQKDPTKEVFAIVDRKEHGHVGNIALQRIDRRNRQAELAIILGEKKVWGRGFGYEAVRILLGYGFTALQLHRVYCGTTADNLPMIVLAERIGMRKEGILKEAMYRDGTFVDVILFGILEHEFSSM